MKTTLLLFLLFNLTLSHAQTDSTILVETPNAENALYVYDSLLQTKLLHYQYFNHCDLDGDGISDSLTFISNGGAHAYFHPVVVLSSDNTEQAFTNLTLDMPFLHTTDTLTESTQFFIKDFDEDGKDEIYLKVENEDATKQESETHYKEVILDYKKGELVVEKVVRFEVEKH
ncbi:hypothetical protein SAMN05216474_0268 [Lishizhenia tianjinensis]|uniref:VCBS repeat-containing protein n=1 Tax=Lishizhenia tianjinensis TaxID=477690 RepID=A0A1I6XLK9_9FLAO|nr:hypothetical protein [Lishizhenia tianjinensis]SFT38704.1 hypothetical protein SAMN05216474_0268 [Lishizhenia tianjinensis]